MVFFCQKVLRKIPGNWTFLIVTDRDELDDQIYKNFANTGADHREAVPGRKRRTPEATADRRPPLRLHADPEVPDTGRRAISQAVRPLRHHRHHRRGPPQPVRHPRHEHAECPARSRLHRLHRHAADGGRGEDQGGLRRLRVSIYNFKQSMDDGATVPLYYENRIPELQLTNEQLNEDMAALLEAAELDEEQEKKLERKFAKEYHLITRDDRLEKIAEDIGGSLHGPGHDGQGDGRLHRQATRRSGCTTRCRSTGRHTCDDLQALQAARRMTA